MRSWKIGAVLLLASFGLRGVAALLVVLHHYVFWTAVVPAKTLPPWLILWTATAGMGMAIFFTLSGYVIALSYLVGLALAIMLATGVYRLVEVPGRRAIRAAADRLLGIRRIAPIAREKGVPAE